MLFLLSMLLSLLLLL